MVECLNEELGRAKLGLPYEIGKDGAAPCIRSNGRVVLECFSQIGECYEEGTCVVPINDVREKAGPKVSRTAKI